LDTGGPREEVTVDGLQELKQLIEVEGAACSMQGQLLLDHGKELVDQLVEDVLTGRDTLGCQSLIVSHVKGEGSLSLVLTIRGDIPLSLQCREALST